MQSHFRKIRKIIYEVIKTNFLDNIGILHLNYTFKGISLITYKSPSSST